MGHRLDGYATSYSISLLAGSTVLNTVNGSNSSIPLGQFARVTLTYTTGSTVETLETRGQERVKKLIWAISRVIQNVSRHPKRG